MLSVNRQKSPPKGEPKGFLPCPNCSEQANAAHFKTNSPCAAVVSRLRGMLC